MTLTPSLGETGKRKHVRTKLTVLLLASDMERVSSSATSFTLSSALVGGALVIVSRMPSGKDEWKRLQRDRSSRLLGSPLVVEDRQAPNSTGNLDGGMMSLQ